MLEVQARGITRPVSLTKTQRKQHYLEGHANYHPGCPFCVRCRGRADRRELRERDEDELQPGDEEEPEDIPTISFDFCFLMQDAAETINRLRIIKKKSTPWEAFRGKHTLRRINGI